MTNPPQGRGPDDWFAEQDRQATQPAPTFERPQQPAASWPGPSQPYGPPGPSAPGATPHGPQPYGPQAVGQPPHGPQPYGQPPAPRSRVGLIVAVTAVVLVVIAGVVVLVLALQSTVLDRAAVERDVAAQFEEREGVAIDLVCEDEMQVDSGSTYECTGVTADDEEVTLQIRIEDESSAAYTWTEP